MTARDDRRSRAYVALEPEQALVAAISTALHVACGIIAAGDARALLTLARDQALCDRAGRRVLTYLLRAMVDHDPPTAQRFHALVRDVIALTKEH